MQTWRGMRSYGVALCKAWLVRRSNLPRLVDLAIFGAATAGTYVAQGYERPVTAVLVYLTGVIWIAVRSGLLLALGAAILASMTYNFFISEPVFTFGVTTLDEAVPLLAFNATALVTGILVGRLRDAALKANKASTDAAFMLTISNRLQTALHVGDVVTTIRDLLPAQGVGSVQLLLSSGDRYARPVSTSVDPPIGGAGNIQGTQAIPSGLVILELDGARGSLGRVQFVLTDSPEAQANLPDIQSITALLAVAVERCMLLQQLAEAEARNRSENLKDALLSSVSHDLRTPLTVIEAAAGALSSPAIKLSEAESARLLQTIIEQCRRLDRYTSELLDVGRIQVGLDPGPLQAIDLVEIANGAIRQTRLAYPDVVILREFAKGMLLVAGNAALLEQAVFNLVHNAARHGGPGPVTVALSSCGGRTQLTITDQGSGIPPLEQERIFDRFYRAGDRPREGSSGLGLFIAKGFIRACGGTIRVTSPISDGRGTSMIVDLPELGNAPCTEVQSL